MASKALYQFLDQTNKDAKKVVDVTTNKELSELQTQLQTLEARLAQQEADAAHAAAQAKALEKARQAPSSSSRRRSTIDTPGDFVAAVTDQAIRQTTRSVGNSLSRSILGTLRRAF